MLPVRPAVKQPSGITHLSAFTIERYLQSKLSNRNLQSIEQKNECPSTPYKSIPTKEFSFFTQKKEQNKKKIGQINKKNKKNSFFFPNLPMSVIKSGQYTFSFGLGWNDYILPVNDIVRIPLSEESDLF